MMKQTLLAMAVSLSGVLSLLFCLAGFVPQVEGPEMRRMVQHAVVHLAEDDMPEPILCCTDGEHLWAYRGDVSQVAIDPKQAYVEPRSSTGQAILFSDDTVLLAADGLNVLFADEELILVPLLALDGISIPLLVGALPSSYGDIFDSDGFPVRWYSDRTLQAGYTPIRIRRFPIAPAEEDVETAKQASRQRKAKKKEESASSEKYKYPPRVSIRVEGVGLMRAVAFQPLIRIYAARFGLDRNLVNAIILSESDFRTRLISKRSAVGLMQVLPKTARGDIHRFLHGTRGNISVDDLFDPELNIQYGTCYLAMLMQRFSWIQDSRSREYCAIAAYNMGPGRVVRVFGESEEEAAETVNAMSAEEVYTTLITRLPRQETRAYLVKVRNAKQEYVTLGLQ